ncbi:MAG: phosphoglycerate kinase, partial [Microgenomates group bacterium]
MSKADCLAKLVNSHGKITIAALDHRGSLKQSLHPDNPDITTDKEILNWKRTMVQLYRDDVAGILIDPIYGKDIIEPNAKNGWMMSMEETGYRGDKLARVTTILPGWSVAQAKAMGACSVKLLLYYDPENLELAKQQKEVATKLANECKQEDIVFLLEPLSYKIETNRVEEVLAIARDLKDIEADIFKFEYPGTREGCVEISKIIRKPWVLLSAGMEYGKYKEALKIAMESGATGFAVGRAVWQEFGDYQGKAREKYFKEVAGPRMRELVEIVNGGQSSEYSPITFVGSELLGIRAINQAVVKGKRVIVRVDWNVTLGKALRIVDDTRIVRTIPTIKWLLEHGAKQIILMSHLGKAEEKKSIKPVVEYASELIGEAIS